MQPEIGSPFVTETPERRTRFDQQITTLKDAYEKGTRGLRFSFSARRTIPRQALRPAARRLDHGEYFAAGSRIVRARYARAGARGEASTCRSVRSSRYSVSSSSIFW